MAASRLIPFPEGSKPAAYLFNLPMMQPEALAFMAHEAGVATPHHYALLKAWVVKMTLVHGTWVADDLTFLQTSNVSQT